MHLVMNKQITAFCNLLPYGPEKVPDKMLEYVPHTKYVTLQPSFLAAPQWTNAIAMDYCNYCFLHHHAANSAVIIQLHHPLPGDQLKCSHKSDIDTECSDIVIQCIFIQCAVVFLTLKQATSKLKTVSWFRRLRKFNCSIRQRNLPHRWSLSLNRWSWSCRDLSKRHVWIHL